MIERIIQFSIKNKFIIGLLVLGLVAGGIYSLLRLPVDAIPDITNNQVQIISRAPSLATQEVESFITSPIEVAVANIPDVVELRSISRLGLSVVTVVFKDGVDIYWARQQLSERLKEAEESIPPGVARTELAPVSTGLGEIYQYRLVVSKDKTSTYSPMELRTLQDWVVRRDMLGTPGVADVNSYGGFVKQYEVAVNPERLRGLNLTLTDVFSALERNNENTGSAYIDKKPNAYFIRGVGLVKSLEDVAKIVVKPNSSGTPILIGDVATVRNGSAIRYGALVIDHEEAVGGVVFMLKGANAHQVIREVEKRVQTIQKALPEGVSIEPFLNRSDLVGRAIDTVSRNLVEGALIVIFILILLLGNFRAGLIVASVIPLSMLFAITMMHLFGVSGNLMSLGAIDFGLIVDGAVIIVESVVHHISKSGSAIPGRTMYTQQEMDEKVFQASSRIRKAATFGEIIILIVYLPILALSGIEGKMFQPMAFVVCFAILGAFLLSLTYVPMISALFLSKKAAYKIDFSDKIMLKLHKVFTPLLEFALRRKRAVSVTAVGIFLASMVAFGALGGEFIPQLEEGDLAAGVMTLQGGSLLNTVDVVKKANNILLEKFPEIKHVVCKIGAGEIPTDPTPMETGDYIITLKDKSEWTSAKTREELVEKIEEALIPLAGVKFEFQQPIQMRFNELLSGSRQDVAIKIFGDDLSLLAENAAKVEKIIAGIEGVNDINVEKVTGLAQVQVEYSRERLAQYGLSVDEVNRVLRTAIAGSEAGVVYEGEKRFGLVVRLDKDYRQDVDYISSLTVESPSGGLVTLDQLADIRIQSGPAQVSREDTKRRITIGFNVRNRDVQSIIHEVQRKIETQVSLPVGYYVTYGGQFENMVTAQNRLAIAVPVALLLIFVLLYFTFKSIKQSMLIFSAVPMAAIGGVWALWLRGMNFSISAGVGFIALFGVAVLNGIVLIAEFNRLQKDGVVDVTERIRQGLHSRLRPVIMTAAVASLGFLPMALSGSAGAEVQKPLATVVIGGLITSTVLTLLILPIFYFYSCRAWKWKRSNLILLLVALVSVSGLSAQNSYKLSQREAVAIALKNNLSIRAAAYSVDAQRAFIGAAVDIPGTTLEVQYGQINSYQKDNSFSVGQSFDFPTVYLYQSQLAKANVKNEVWKGKSVELAVASQVKQVYNQLTYLYTKKGMFSWQDSVYTAFDRAADLRLKTGEGTRLEMLTARTQSKEVRNAIQEVLSDIRIYTKQLQQLMNVNYEIELVDTVLKKTDYVPLMDTLLLKENPTLKQMYQQTDVARLESQVVRSKSLPGFTFGYFSQTIRGEQQVGGGAKVYGLGDRFTGVQAGLSVPLWWGANAAKAKATRIKAKTAQVEAENLTAQLMTEYENLMTQFQKNQKSVDYYEQQVIPEADLIVKQLNVSYHAGQIDYSEYVQGLSRAFQLRLNYLNTLKDYNEVLVAIEGIVGINN